MGRWIDILTGLFFKFFRILLLPARILLRPQIQKYVTFSITLVTIYVGVAVILTYFIAPLLANINYEYWEKEFAGSDKRSRGVLVHDINQQIVGVYPPFESDYLTRAKYGELLDWFKRPDVDIYPDHKAFHILKAPKEYWRCLRYLEDGNLGSIWNPYGIDLLGIIRFPYDTLRKSYKYKKLIRGAGGSTLAMIFAKSYYQKPSNMKEGFSVAATRKFNEYFLAPKIHKYLMEDADNSRFARYAQWSANHLSHIIDKNEPMNGIERASKVIFNVKNSSKLKPHQLYILAASVKRQVLLPSAQSDENVLGRWNKIKVRAQKCIAEFSPPENLEHAKRALGKETPPKFDNLISNPELRKAIAKLSKRQQTDITNDYLVRARRLAPSVMRGLRAELTDAFHGNEWRAYLNNIILSLDLAANINFKNKLSTQLVELDKCLHVKRSRRKRKCRQIRGTLKSDYSINPNNIFKHDIRVPYIVIAAADPTGRIVRYYETRNYASYFGSPTARTQKASGTYNRQNETRPIASLGKIVAGILLANSGGNAKSDLYSSSMRSRRMQKSGCSSLCKLNQGRCLCSPDIAFGKSLNYSIIDQINLQLSNGSLSRSDILDVLNKLGITLPANNSADLATTLAFGLVGASPQTIHKLSSIILNSIITDGLNNVSPPSLIARCKGNSSGLSIPLNLLNRQYTKRQDIISPNAITYLKHTLAQPICLKTKHGGAIGTMAMLNKWCANDNQEIASHFAKSGTHSSNGNTRDVWITGGIQFQDGPAYSYVATIGFGGDSGEAWGNRLNAGQILAPLVDLLLQDLKSGLNDNIATYAPEFKPLGVFGCE